VVTNRLVRRVILYAVERLAYDPAGDGKQLRFPNADRQIDIRDAIRARRAE
jgi:hypothetical protein